MNITYDPIAGELEIDPANGLPPLIVKATKLFVHIHSNGGHLGCEVQGEQIDLLFEAVDPISAIPIFTTMSPGHWRLSFLVGDHD